MCGTTTTDTQERGHEMSKQMEVAERAEKVLNDEINYGYDSKQAVLFAVVSSLNDTITLT